MNLNARAAFSLENIVKRSPSQPDRIVLYADPGWGKTSFAARMPAPIFLLTPGEDRLKKLVEQGLCPETAHFSEIATSWADVESAVDALTLGGHELRTFVIDTGNGAERLAAEQVCAQHFDGDWGERGFTGFARGEKITADDLWVSFLEKLDRLRVTKKMRIVLLCHKGVTSVKNPESADYEKSAPALSKRIWGYTSKWADMILYGTLEMQISKDDPKSKLAKNKAKGGRVRLLHTMLSPAYEAKNVHRLPATIRLGDDPDLAYDRFRAAFPAKAGAEKLSGATPEERQNDERISTNAEPDTVHGTALERHCDIAPPS